ncbi:hypothetical protein [Pseudomonas lini]
MADFFNRIDRFLPVTTGRSRPLAGINTKAETPRADSFTTLDFAYSKKAFTVSGDSTMNSRGVIKSASLTFRGFDLTLEEVDRIVGVTATQSGLRDNPVKQGVTTLLKRSFACYEVNFIDGCRLDEMIPKLLEYLGGAIHLRDAKDKIRPEFLEINLVLPVKGSVEQEGGYLPPRILAEIALLDATLSFSFL